MSVAHSFNYVARTDARVLILGSMPGVVSLAAQRYYAHERNQFWPIILSLLQADETLAYEQRLATLVANKIALWDVLAECYREGSLDTAIARDSMRCNDFVNFFTHHADITAIAFNGKTAQQIFQRRVLPQLSAMQQKIPHLVLPSTSPAHAALSLRDKQEQWHQSLTTVLPSR